MRVGYVPTHICIPYKYADVKIGSLILGAIASHNWILKYLSQIVND
jgi:hypothetical protein